MPLILDAGMTFLNAFGLVSMLKAFIATIFGVVAIGAALHHFFGR